jgi:hypothetical protein
MKSRVVRWVSKHDENWPFFFLYLAASILLTLLFNLGFFLVLIFIHFLLDFIKHWHSGNRKTDHVRYAALYAFRDGFLLDFFLLVIAFAFGYVFHFTFAVSIANGTRLLTFLEIEDIVRVLSRVVLADWIVTHISWLSRHMKQMDTGKLYMSETLIRHEVLMMVGIVLILGSTLLIPYISGSGFEPFWAYTKQELIPRFI